MPFLRLNEAVRVPHGRPPQLLSWLLLFVCSGCGGDPEGLVSVEGRRVHRPLLLSEIQSSPDPQSLLDRQFEFRNSRTEPASLRFDGAGCSCYQITADNRPLAAGDVLTIPAQGTLPVSIGVPTPTGAGSPEYLARFSWLRDGEDPVELPISLSLPVYADLSILPSAITAGYRPGEVPTPIPLRVTLHSRDAAAVQTAPVVSDLPEMLRLGEWREVNRERPADDLWKVIWQADLQLDVPEGFRQQVTTALSLRAGVGPVSSTRLSVLIQPLVGVRNSSTMQFGLLKSGEQRRRRTLLTAADKRPFRVTATECDDPRCRARVLSTELADRHWLEVEAELTDETSLQAELVCTTDHPESPRIVIEVQAENAARFGAAVLQEPASASPPAEPSPLN